MSIVIGYVFFIANIALVLSMTTAKHHIFLDLNGALAVLISTFCFAFIGFRPAGAIHLIKLFAITIKRKEDPLPEMLKEVIKVAKDSRGEITQSYASNFNSPNFFLTDGIKLIGDGFNEEQISTILFERIEATRDRYEYDEKMLKTLRAVPPAFGMLGTTMGLIALFAEIGGADALKSIGPAMAIALTSTLYGLITAYIVISPLTERLIVINNQDLRIREMTRKGVLLIKKKSPPSYIEEILVSYLPFKKQKN